LALSETFYSVLRIGVLFSPLLLCCLLSSDYLYDEISKKPCLFAD